MLRRDQRAVPNADHSYTGCSNDIDFWYPKIRDGGILAGHDYCNGNPQKGHVYGVIQAVAQLVDEHDLELFVTSDAYPSWMVVKGNHTTQSLKAQTVLTEKLTTICTYLRLEELHLNM